MDPPILTSRRFRRSYRKSNAALQGLFEGAVHDLVNRIRELPETFMQSYGRLAQLSEVLEVDVTGACRLLATWLSERLVLLDCGDHDIVRHYTPGNLYIDTQTPAEAPLAFWPERAVAELRFFTRNPCLSYAEYDLEQSQEWLYRLSSQQEHVVDEVLWDSAVAHESGKLNPPFFIVGGPGTGKTSVLLNLLKSFRDLGIHSKLVLNKDLADYIQACMPDIDRDCFCIKGLETPSADIVLVDDPNNTKEVVEWVVKCLDGDYRLVILAFDPCQLNTFDPRNMKSGMTDEDFSMLCQLPNTTIFDLDQCYRQKENVGHAAKKAMDAIAESTPFLNWKKVEVFRSNHRHLTELSNDLRFPNPHGYLQVYENANLQDLEKELDRIMGLPLWKHWPPLLLVVDRAEDHKSGPWLECVHRRTIESKTVVADEADKVKGLEFQHSFLFLGRDLFQQLEKGFEGSGQAEYMKRRLIRIPYSRAKDSMVVFVI